MAPIGGRALATRDRAYVDWQNSVPARIAGMALEELLVGRTRNEEPSCSHFGRETATA